jgi:hypothetical protein
MFVMVFHWILMYQHHIDFHENAMYVKLVGIYLQSPENEINQLINIENIQFTWQCNCR